MNHTIYRSSIDVGPVMTAKILKQNGENRHRSTYQELSQDEWDSCKYKVEHGSFMESVHQRLGPKTTVGNLPDINVEGTPQYNSYKDASQNIETFPVWMKNQWQLQSGKANV